MKYRRVYGEARVLFTVELPAETAHEKVSCDDPAVEAALETIGANAEIFLWGEEKAPARVMVELFEEDIDIEEDEDVEEDIDIEEDEDVE